MFALMVLWLALGMEDLSLIPTSRHCGLDHHIWMGESIWWLCWLSHRLESVWIFM